MSTKNSEITAIFIRGRWIFFNCILFLGQQTIQIIMRIDDIFHFLAIMSKIWALWASLIFAGCTGSGLSRLDILCWRRFNRHGIGCNTVVCRGRLIFGGNSGSNTFRPITSKDLDIDRVILRLFSGEKLLIAPYRLEIFSIFRRINRVTTKKQIIFQNHLKRTSLKIDILTLMCIYSKVKSIFNNIYLLGGIVTLFLWLNSNRVWKSWKYVCSVWTKNNCTRKRLFVANNDRNDRYERYVSKLSIFSKKSWANICTSYYT